MNVLVQIANKIGFKKKIVSNITFLLDVECEVEGGNFSLPASVDMNQADPT
jgi:hypothetical protein